ncbi:MAG: efflux RND transporter periplasmic adaptor subunit [Ramlibacter sp.]|nr:efflux RND transporter periplasmic adaptor subunit [Ramlibacter sp.]
MHFLNALASLLTALALAGAAHSAPATVAVPVVKAGMQAVAAGFEFDGVVQPVTQSTVAAQVGGRIARLAVKAGDPVRAGQVLATIDDRETRTGLQRSQAQAAQAEAEYRNARAQFERTRELQSKGFVSMAALDTAQAAFNAAQAGRDQAAAGQRQSAIEQGFTQVTAPYDGWVLETLVQSGDLAVPGKPLLTLYAPLPLRVVVHVPASRAAEARAAAQVEIMLDGGPGKGQWISPVSRIMLPAADPVAQTLEWRLELPAGTARSAAPGQQVHVRFSGGTQKRLIIPAGAVLRRGELTAVYVAAPGGAGFVLKAVRLGADHGAAGVEVLAGLGSAELVAVDPVKAGLAGARPALAP